MKKLKAGDLLYILSIDRLGRNYEEIQKQWRIITKDKNVDVCVIDIPDNFAAIIKLWEQKKLQCNMSEAIFYRRLREYRLLHKK